jgi:TolB-like protein/DNA-binding winged helix-turn-helix (wHTH) protein
MDPSTHGPAPPHIARFGSCCVDLHSRELFKDGKRIRLQNQSFQILAALLEQQGTVITREGLHGKLWPGQEFADFDQGLNTVIMRLRRALGDTAETPMFIETLPRHGYRFIAPVTFSNGAADHQGETPEAALEVPESLAGEIPDHHTDNNVPERTRARWWHTWIIVGLSAIVLALLAIIFASGRLRTSLGFPARKHALPTLAVLPFDSLSSDPVQGFMAEGMTEQLITELGKCRELRVVSRGSVMQYSGKHLPLEIVAKDLNADDIFEGSITESGGRLRVTGNLYQVATRKHLWAEAYQRDAGNRLVTEQQIVLDMALNIEKNLTSTSR